LDERLTRPDGGLVEASRAISSPLVVLGAGGKMGPTLAVLAQRAAAAAGRRLEVIAVSRFGDPAARGWLEERGVRTVACDLLESESLTSLPDAANLLYLVGLKFGTSQNPAATWAINTLVPARVAARYGGARLVALSTGNVYPLTPVAGGGSVETDPLTPVGEYANAAVGRERVFEYCSRRYSLRVALLRLYYATELRYGIVTDLARKVLRGEAIDLTNGYFNCIWQGDANAMILRALALAEQPPTAWNLCRPERFSVRTTAELLGEAMGCQPRFAGLEADTALLGDSTRLCAVLGDPATPMSAMLRWTAHWTKTGGRSLDRPTHFEVRDGQY
jgi:nucleoside-diphosphate-sugar epimerase